MKKDDFDPFGKGLEDYIHYKQFLDEFQKSSPNRPVKKSSTPPPSGDDSWETFKVILGGIVAIGGGLALLIWIISVFYNCM